MALTLVNFYNKKKSLGTLAKSRTLNTKRRVNHRFALKGQTEVKLRLAPPSRPPPPFPLVETLLREKSMAALLVTGR